MNVQPSSYRSPWWLRSSHLQTILASSPARRRRGAAALQSTGALTEQVVVDAGNGVRLQGAYSTVPGKAPRALALLLHGWEGSIESSYMQKTAALLLAQDFAVFRLNFRDHGNTHHLNEGLFHSNLIDEVVNAAGDVAGRFPARPMFAAGYSLGGNFALRLALRAPEMGVPLSRVVAVCPVLDPALTMDQMEAGSVIYMRHFEREWRASLLRKRELFPQLYDFDDATVQLPMRELTRWMVERHTSLRTLDNYFEGYSIAGPRLAALQVPVDILTSADDPLIPVREFRALQLPDNASLEIADHGGHCGFLMNGQLEGFAEYWVAQRLAAVADMA